VSDFGNLLGGPEPTHLPDDSAVRHRLDAGADPVEVAADNPDVPLAWAVLAERSLALEHTVEGYAFARVGYHRGLDLLRRSGWKGHGPIPWEHEPNRGFLRSLHALGQAAAAIGEEDEAARCAQFLRDSSMAAFVALDED
jgi:hypothetical protein